MEGFTLLTIVVGFCIGYYIVGPMLINWVDKD